MDFDGFRRFVDSTFDFLWFLHYKGRFLLFFVVVVLIASAR